MEITALVKAKKSNRVNVYIDDEYAANLTIDTIAKYSLFKEKLLTESMWQEILSTDQIQRLYFKAQELIAHRPRSLSETKKYLQQKIKQNVTDESLSGTIVEKVLEKLKSKSKAELTQELRIKGIASEIINSVLEEKYDQSQELELIRKTILKKYKTLNPVTLKSDKKLFQKLLAYMGRRGFSYRSVNLALDNEDEI